MMRKARRQLVDKSGREGRLRRQRVYSRVFSHPEIQFAIKWERSDEASRALKYFTVDADDEGTTHWLTVVTDVNNETWLEFRAKELFTALIPNENPPARVVTFLNNLAPNLLRRINSGNVLLFDLFTEQMLDRLTFADNIPLPPSLEE